MADLALVTANRVFVVGEPDPEHTRSLIAGVAISAGQAIVADGTTGRWVLADANTAALARNVYIALRSVRSGMPLTAVKGNARLDGFDLGSLPYNTPVFLSATAGALSDGALGVGPAGINEQQTVTITGSPVGGDFTLTYAGQTTAAIAYNATAAAVEDALELLSTIGQGNVEAAGGPLPGTAVTVRFIGDLAGQGVAAMTASGAGLTGGTTPAVAVTTPVEGAAGLLVGYVMPGLAQSVGSDPDRILDLALL